MKRTLSIVTVLGSLLLVGCGTSAPSAVQPLVPPTAVPSAVASSSTARSSDAKPLGMTQQELRTEISAGKSINDILKSKGIKVPTATASSVGKK